MKTEPITNQATSKVIAGICADGHKRITYYGEATCPLCTALGTVAILLDQLAIAQYDLQTAKEAK